MSSMSDNPDWLADKLRALGVLPPADAPALKIDPGAYVRASDRDIRARGLEYNAQLELGDRLDEAEGFRQPKSVSTPGGDEGANFTHSLRPR